MIAKTKTISLAWPYIHNLEFLNYNKYRDNLFNICGHPSGLPAGADVEAAVVVVDVGYGKDEIQTRIKVESLRESDELAEVDSALLITSRRLDQHEVLSSEDRLKSPAFH